MTDTDLNAVLHHEAVSSGPAYAGFWLRFVAFIIDFFMSGAVMIPVGLLGAVPFVFFSAAAESDPNEVLKVMANAYAAVYIFAICSASWFYFIVFECSKLQATPGKLALGLRVTDERGNRITFLRSVSRTLGKILSGSMFCLGFIAAGLTPRKQALHDLMAGCLVVRARSGVGQIATSTPAIADASYAPAVADATSTPAVADASSSPAAADATTSHESATDVASTPEADQDTDSKASSSSTNDSEQSQTHAEPEHLDISHRDSVETAPASGETQSSQPQEQDSSNDHITISAPI